MVRITVVKAANASAPRCVLEHCETLRAITAGRSARSARLLVGSIAGLWRNLVQRGQVSQTVVPQLVMPGKFLSDSHPVDPLAALKQVDHAREDTSVPFEREIVGIEINLSEPGVVQEDGAKDESFRVEVGG